MIGARFATSLPAVTLQRVFGIFLLIVAMKMIVTAR